MVDVRCETLGSWGRDDAVEDTFCGGDRGCGGAQVAREVEEVSSNRKTSPLLLHLVWLRTANEPAVCDALISRNLRLPYKEDGVGSLNVTYALRQLT